MDVLKQLAYLEKPILHETFDFTEINTGTSRAIKNTQVGTVLNCGSAGCLIGELPAFTKDFTFNALGKLLYRGTVTNLATTVFVAAYFNIHEDLLVFMFYADSEIPIELEGSGVLELENTATLKEVQHNLRIIINKLEDGTLDKYILPDVTDSDADKSTISESDL